VGYSAPTLDENCLDTKDESEDDNDASYYSPGFIDHFSDDPEDERFVINSEDEVWEEQVHQGNSVAARELGEGITASQDTCISAGDAAILQQ
jgi:hypothetical protein